MGGGLSQLVRVNLDMATLLKLSSSRHGQCQDERPPGNSTSVALISMKEEKKQDGNKQIKATIPNPALALNSLGGLMQAAFSIGCPLCQ